MNATPDRTSHDAEVVALGAARAADAIANSFLIVVLPLYIASGRVDGRLYGLSVTAATGLILAGFGLFNAGLQPLAGRLSDVSGRRKAWVVGGLVALMVLTWGFSLATSYVAVLLIRLAQGVAVAFTITASIALVNELSGPGNRGANMGTYNGLRLLGFGAGPLVAGFVVSSGPYDVLGRSVSGFDAAFYLATLAVLVSTILVGVLVRDPDNGNRRAPARFRIPVLAARPDRTLDPVFVLGVGSMVMAICIALLASIETDVNARLGQGPRWFGVEFAAFILSVSMLQPVVGRLSDRYGRRPFVVAGLALLAPTTLIQGLVTSPAGMVAARLAQGIAGSMTFAPALALGGDLARRGESGARLSVLTMGFGIGISVGQLLSGFLVGWHYLVPFATGAVLAALAAVLVAREVEEPLRTPWGPDGPPTGKPPG